MKIKAIKDFVDQNTREYIKAGMVLRNLPVKRCKELIEKGVAVEVKE